MESPKIQSGIAMHLFTEKSLDVLDKISSQYKGPRIISFPPHLTNYVRQVLTPELVSKNFKSVLPTSCIEASSKDYTLFIITTPEKELIEDYCDLFRNVPNYTKVILVIPKYSVYLKSILNDKGFICVEDNKPNGVNEVGVYNFQCNFLPIGNDFFLLPCYNSFSNIILKANYNDIEASALVLSRIENVFGFIPEITCIGEYSDKISLLLQQFGSRAPKSKIPQIDSLIIVDRSFDLITPLLTEVHFEGYIETAYNTSYGITETENKKTLFLTENNEVFRKVRTMSWNKTKEYLLTVQDSLNKNLDAIKNSVNVKEQKIYFDNLSKLNLLKEQLTEYFQLANNAVKKNHDLYPLFEEIVQAEFNLLYTGKKIIDFAENLVTIYDDWFNALRLIFLQNAFGNYLGMKDVGQVQHSICSEFGLSKCQESLINLEKIGYLSFSEFKIPMKGCLSGLSLFADVNENMESIEPIGSAFGGYIPPALRVVQKIVDGELDSLNKLIGEKVKITHYGEPSIKEANETKRIIVFFVGGVTSLEEGTIRNLGRSIYDGKIEFIIGSTEKINSTSFLHQLCPFL